jgi:hypothetical protein
MKRILGHAVAVLSLAVGLACVAPACTTNDETIYVRPALFPSAARTATGECTYTADPTQPVNLEPRLDVGVRDDYIVVTLVGNQLVTKSDPTNARAESNRVHINGAVVRITNPDGSDIKDAAGNTLGNFTSLTTGMADPGTGTTPGFAVVGIRVVDAPTANVLAASLANRTQTRTIVVNIKVFGKTIGNVDVESGEYQMPLVVCRGCLVTFPAASVDPAAPTPNCNKPFDTGSTTTATLRPCFDGQDEPTSCQFCQGRVIKTPQGDVLPCDPKTP